MKKHFKSIDGALYLNVTPQAKKLWQSVDLFVLWEKGDKTYRLPINTEEELNFALHQEGKSICMEIGTEDELSLYIHKNIEKWSQADTITHNGFIYVRCNDIL